MRGEMLGRIMEAVGRTTEFMKNLNEDEAGALICMLMEEWCRVQDEDVVEFSQMLADMVRQVNWDLGKYECKEESV